MDKLQIIKVGGTLINNEDLLEELLNAFSRIEGAKILVHGGGRKATALSKTLGIEPQMIDGRRITDAATLDVVVMVYAGLINKNIVAKLQTKEINALGLTGADLNIIQSHKRVHPTIDFGMVGDIDAIAGDTIKTLVEAGFVPVLSPITHDKKGQLLNTNADTIAAEIAKTMSTHFDVSLKYCFEFPGVMADIEKDTIPIPKIDKTIFENLKSAGKVHSGMLPKLENALAVTPIVHKVAICGISNLTTEKNLTWIG